MQKCKTCCTFGLLNLLAMPKLLIFILILSLPFPVKAQPELTLYTDLGRSNVSKVVYIRPVISTGYTVYKNQLTFGYQWNGIYSRLGALSGYRFGYGRDFTLKTIPFKIQAFYVNVGSKILRESNVGLALTVKPNHFDLTIGTNFKTYAYTKSARELYGIPKDARSLNEVWNILYNFTYYLKPTDHVWNTGLSLTNFDYFTFNQETNPMLKLVGQCDLTVYIRLFTEIWYKPAGLTNLEPNFFGLFIRGGVAWKID